MCGGANINHIRKEKAQLQGHEHSKHQEKHQKQPSLEVLRGERKLFSQGKHNLDWNREKSSKRGLETGTKLKIELDETKRKQKNSRKS